MCIYIFQSRNAVCDETSEKRHTFRLFLALSRNIDIQKKDYKATMTKQVIRDIVYLRIYDTMKTKVGLKLEAVKYKAIEDEKYSVAS